MLLGRGRSVFQFGGGEEGPGVLVGRGLGNVDFFMGEGVSQGQTIGPEGGGAMGVLAAVADVAQQGQTPGGKLHPYLVGTTGVETDADQ